MDRENNRSQQHNGTLCIIKRCAIIIDVDLFALSAHRRTIWAVLGELCVCVCVCVCGGGGGGGGGGGEQPPVPTPMSYVTVFKL